MNELLNSGTSQGVRKAWLKRPRAKQENTIALDASKSAMAASEHASHAENRIYAHQQAARMHEKAASLTAAQVKEGKVCPRCHGKKYIGSSKHFGRSWRSASKCPTCSGMGSFPIETSRAEYYHDLSVSHAHKAENHRLLAEQHKTIAHAKYVISDTEHNRQRGYPIGSEVDHLPAFADGVVLGHTWKQGVEKREHEAGEIETKKSVRGKIQQDVRPVGSLHGAPKKKPKTHGVYKPDFLKFRDVHHDSEDEAWHMKNGEECDCGEDVKLHRHENGAYAISEPSKIPGVRHHKIISHYHARRILDNLKTKKKKLKNRAELDEWMQNKGTSAGVKKSWETRRMEAEETFGEIPDVGHHTAHDWHKRKAFEAAARLKTAKAGKGAWILSLRAHIASQHQNHWAAQALHAKAAFAHAKVSHEHSILHQHFADEERQAAMAGGKIHFHNRMLNYDYGLEKSTIKPYSYLQTGDKDNPIQNCKSAKFRKMLASMQKEYGDERGESVAYATWHKMGNKDQHTCPACGGTGFKDRCNCPACGGTGEKRSTFPKEPGLSFPSTTAQYLRERPVNNSVPKQHSFEPQKKYHIRTKWGVKKNMTYSSKTPWGTHHFKGPGNAAYVFKPHEIIKSEEA